MENHLDRSEIMRRVRSSDTPVEVMLRKALWAKGLRYSIKRRDLPGKPDIALPARRLAIFVDGDLWHGYQWRSRCLKSLEEQFSASANKNYWISKIRRNMQRDSEATSKLLRLGWRVLRFWESDVLTNLEACVQMTLEVALKQLQADSYSRVPQKTFAEFFAGIGLMRMGLEQQGWAVAYANDIDEQKHEMYRGHFGDSAEFDVSDIHTVPAARIPSVTLCTASFPCNDLSLAGSRNGLKGQHSSAFWGFTRILDDMRERRPPLILLENVPGFLTSHEGKDIVDALKSLNALGYAVDLLQLDASLFVPQSRQRLFVIGVKDPKGRSNPITLTPENWETDARPAAVRRFIIDHPGIHWALRDLPNVNRREVSLARIIEELPDSAPEWWSQARADYLLSQMSPRHQKVAEMMISGHRWSYGTVFRRVRQGRSMAELRTDGLAGCLRTPRGGSGRQILFKAGYGRYWVRLLTPRECARLMGADDYNITVPLNQALFGFGDAVCVPVVSWLAENYLNPLINELIRDVPLVPTAAEVAG